MAPNIVSPTPPLSGESASGEEAGMTQLEEAGMARLEEAGIPTAESLSALRAQLDEAQATIAHLERERKVDALLHEADAIDLEAARLLTERAIDQMDEPDVALAVADLRRHKPYLFADTSPFARRLAQERRETASGSAMGPRVAGDPTDVAAQRAASQALETGNRRALLEYMRLKRRSP